MKSCSTSSRAATLNADPPCLWPPQVTPATNLRYRFQREKSLRRGGACKNLRCVHTEKIISYCAGGRHGVYSLPLPRKKDSQMNFPYCRATILSLTVLIALCTPPTVQCETPVEVRASGGSGDDNMGRSRAVTRDTAAVGATARAQPTAHACAA